MRLTLLVSAALIAGCGSKDAADSGGADTDSPTTPAPTYEATWAGVQQMFNDSCDRCHPAVQGIDLHTAIPEDIANGTGTYVVAGDADSSLLWELIGTPTLNFMPQDGALPAESVEHVKEWINNGAMVD